MNGVSVGIQSVVETISNPMGKNDSPVIGVALFAMSIGATFFKKKSFSLENSNQASSNEEGNSIKKELNSSRSEWPSIGSRALLVPTNSDVISLPNIVPSLVFSVQSYSLSERISKRDMYQKANEEHNFDLVRQLNDLGMKPIIPLFSGPAIISNFMDIATKYDIILSFLKKLRQTNRLLSEKEFRSLSSRTWIRKNSLSRILGCEHLVRKITENQLKHIKVPLKIAVIGDDVALLEVRGHEYEDLYDINSEQIKIYAEEIKRVDRKLSRDEIDELIQVIAAANFTDLNLSNIVVAEDGIYFIDTELKSFRGSIMWGEKINRFESLMNEEDKGYFCNRVKEKIEEAKPHLEMDSYDRLKTGVEVLKRYPNPSSEELIKEMENKVLDFEYVGAKKAGHCCFKPNNFLFNLSDILV